MDLDAVAKQQKSLHIKKSVDEMVNNYKATGSVSNNIINTTLLRASTSSNLLKGASISNLNGSVNANAPSVSTSINSPAGLTGKDRIQSLDVKNLVHANEK